MLKRVDESVDASKTVLHFHDFLPGSVVAIRVSLTSESQSAVVQLRSLLTGLTLPTKSSSLSLAAPNWEELERVLSSMTLTDLNLTAATRRKSKTAVPARTSCRVVAS